MPDASTLADLMRRSVAGPSSVNEAARTVEVIASTGADVRRYGYRPDGTYGAWTERLDVAGADLSRFIGASVLRDHRPAVESVVGVVDSAKVAGAEIHATVRFDQRSEAETLWQSVKAGIVRQVSAGYTVSAWKRDDSGEVDAPTFTATSWTPLELSFVAVGADPNAKVRSNPAIEANMTASVSTQPATTAAPLPDASDREVQIRSIAGLPSFRIPDELVTDVIASGATIDQARSVFIAHLARQSDSIQISSISASAAGSSHAEPDNRRNHMADAIAARFTGASLTGPSEQFRGMSLLECGAELLAMRGVSTRGWNKHHVAEALLGGTPAWSMRGQHTTSDFPLLLSAVANKLLLSAYETADQGFRRIARVVDVTDFREMKMLRAGEYPELEKVRESGEYKRGTMGEAAEGIRVETYGKMVGLSRQAIINDDLGAFNETTQRIGRTAAHLEGKLCAELIEANPTMSEDGKALFHADHKNLTTPGSAIGINSISAGREAMRKQSAIDSDVKLSIRPKFLVVPPSLETAAEKIVAEITAAETGNVNPFAGKLDVVVDVRLTSGTAWYLAADQTANPGLTVAYLAGARGPQIFTKEGWDVDGVEFKARLDFGAAALDFRSLHKNPGA